MINIKELSVGNWVKFPHGIDKIDELCKRGNYAAIANRPVSAERLEPIEITPAILEKNGGFYPKGSAWMKLDNHYRELWICKHTDGMYWLYSSGDCDKDENFAEIRYVHQLQNALTLCGIDKEIEL